MSSDMEGRMQDQIEGAQNTLEEMLAVVVHPVVNQAFREFHEHPTEYKAACVVRDVLWHMQLTPTQWLPIKPVDSAPRYKDILCYRADAGVFMGIFAPPSQWMNERQIEDNAGEDWVHEDAWFAYCAEGMFRLEGNEVPTHWMPLPTEPKP